MEKSAIYIIILGVFLQSCTPTFKVEEELDVDRVEISHNQESLTARVNHFNYPLVIDENGVATVYNPNQYAKISPFQAGTAMNESPLDHTWYFVAEVDPPVFEGETLSATHVQVIDDKAYVSYNKQGSTYLGGLEVYDLSNKAYPQIISQILFNNADVNAITADYEGGSGYRKIWLALSHRARGAVVREIELIDGLISDGITDVNLSDFTPGGISASANGIVRSGDRLFVTSGKTYGGLFTLNANDLSFIDSDFYSNAKYVAANGRDNNARIASLITGDSAYINIKAQNSDEIANTIQIGPVLHQNVEGSYRGKSVIHFAEAYPDVAFVAMGGDGLKGFDITTGEERFYTSNHVLTIGNTNGITSDDDYLYMANGADGLGVALIPEQNGNVETVFTWDLSEYPASANYLITDGEWIFIAKGGKGLKILRKREDGEHRTLYGIGPYGVPLGMEPENFPVCVELLPNIYNNVLPEQSNVLERNPEFFDNPNRELELLKDDKVYITFITERAGYKNALGFYYYHKDHPPSSVDELEKWVVFPNASADGHGGKLVEGNTMKLLGSFEEGTVIGFYLISNGWNGFEITNGIYTQYTIPEFNVSEMQQSIIFHDQRCSSVVMTFEDIALPKGDKDFNDVIFMISTEDSTSFDRSVFIQQ